MLLNLFITLDDLKPTFAVRVTPKASKNMAKIAQNADGKPLIKVYVTAAADKGKANSMVLKILAKELNLPKTALVIVKGETSRDKVIQILEKKIP